MIFKKSCFIFLTLILTLVATSSLASAKKQIILATTEHEPYIGVNLPNKGYAHELITTIYKNAGYDVIIEFYPLARAKFLAEKGSVDGYFPANIVKKSTDSFIYSAPFPGDIIGLLKKKNLFIPQRSTADNLTTQLLALKRYDFGLIRGENISPIFDEANYLHKQYASHNLQNIDKLMKGRIDFVVADKYTLADLMVAHRPHLIGHFEFLPSPTFSNNFHIALSKNSSRHQQLHNDFNLGLQQLQQDGTLDNILKKHGFFPPSTKQEGITHLIIGTVNNKDMLIMENLSAIFEKDNPTIKLQWRVLSETILRKRLMSDLAISDGQYDIMTIGSYEAPNWAKRGWITPLNTLPDDYNINDLVTSVRERLSYNNTLYALPFYAESSMLFYRQDLFTLHNLVMPSQPSYQDIINFAAIIHDPEQQLYGICMRGKAGWGENIAVLSSMVHANGGQWFNEQWQPQLDSPLWYKSVSDYITLIKHYSHPQSKSYGFKENLSLFKKGHCGLWIDATVAASILFNPLQSAVFNKIKYTSSPTGISLESTHWLWSWALAIPQSSKHKQAALKFITWATSTQYIEKVAKHHGWLSAPAGTRKSTYRNNNYINAAPFAPFVLAKLQDGKILGSILRTSPDGAQQMVNIPEFHALGDYVGQQMVKIIEGKISIHEALQKAQIYAEEQMSNLGYYKNIK